MRETTFDGRRAAILAFTTFALGVGWILMRPGLQAVSHEATVLALGYVLVGATAILVPLPASTDEPALSRRSALLIGVVAMLLAARLIGPAIPTPVTFAAPMLNVLAAISEEALFRRVAFGWLRPLGAVTAVISTALLFALVHVPLYGTEALPVDLGAGLLLSWQREACGTWTVPATTHAAANLLAMIG